MLAKRFLVALITVAALAVPVSARADNAPAVQLANPNVIKANDIPGVQFLYVCYVGHYDSFGTYGHLSALLYSGPNCTGKYVSWLTACSVGADLNGPGTTGSYCSASNLYSEVALQNLQTLLQNAGYSGKPISMNVEWNTQKLTSVVFWAGIPNQ